MPERAIPILSIPHRLRGSIPEIATIAWLCLLGWLIFRHVLASEQPLIGDARAYWLKAHNFWSLVATGSLFNPFNVDPSGRPPGTVLMSYPFGFSESTKGFLFRSIFIAIALTAAAVHMAGRVTKPSVDRRIDIACIALFICSAPLFYHFEYGAGSPTYWGLVDCFLAGTAAIATALALHAATRSSKAAALLAAVFASICYAIKPAGLLIALLIAVTWVVVGVGVRARRGVVNSTPAPPDFRSLIVGLLIYGGIVGPVVIMGRFSEYFSSANIAYGNRVLGFLNEKWLSTNFAGLLRYIDSSLGAPIAIAMVIVLLLGLLPLRTLADRDASVERRVAPFCACSALVFIVCGLWFWIIYTGGSQVRYFYPFALCALVLLMPTALALIGDIPRKAKVVLRSLLLLPAANITLLLMVPNPAPAWEQLSRVNIRMHEAHNDLVFARKLLQSVRNSGHRAVVYEDMSGQAGVVESFWGFELVANPSLPNVSVTGPVDFISAAAYRIQEIAASDFLLFPVVKDPEELAKRLGTESVADYAAEERLFQAWFSTLDSRNGVRTFAETDELRLLEIVDRSTLEQSLQELRRVHQWRAAFVDANPQGWWSETEILAQPNIRLGHDGAVDFGGKFLLRAVSVKAEADHLALNFWWRQTTDAPMPDEWYFFVHGVDASGTGLTNSAARLRRYTGPESGTKYRMQSLEVPLTAGAVPSALAVGIYRALPGSAETLTADRGTRDWGNHRVLISWR